MNTTLEQPATLSHPFGYWPKDMLGGKFITDAEAAIETTPEKPEPVNPMADPNSLEYWPTFPLPTASPVGGKMVITKPFTIVEAPIDEPVPFKLTLEMVNEYLDSVAEDDDCGTIGSTRDCVLARAARFHGAKRVEVGYHCMNYQYADRIRFQTNEPWAKHIIEQFDLLTTPSVANVREIIRGL